jgi:hypothetical protein
VITGPGAIAAPVFLRNRAAPMEHYPIERDLRRHEATTWGTRPRPAIRQIRWQPVFKYSLDGFASIELPNGLRILHCPPFSGNNSKAWTALPSRPVVNEDGRHKREVNNKPTYAPVLEWRTATLRLEFSQRVVELVREQHPRELGGGR